MHIKVLRSLSPLLPDANAFKVLECLSRYGGNASEKLLWNGNYALFQSPGSHSLELKRNKNFSLKKSETILEKLENVEMLLQFKTPSEQVRPANLMT